MAKKRERLDIIFDILKVVNNSNNKIGPTKLLRFSNLSPQMFKDYSEELIEKDFIELINEGNKNYYILIEKGFEFLKEYQKIKKFIENFGL